MRLFLILILLCTIFHVFSQKQTELDGFGEIVGELPREGSTYISDTARIRTIYETALQIQPLDSSIYLLTKAYNLATKIPYRPYCQKIAFWIGKKNKLRGTYFEAIDFFYKSLTYAETLNDEYAMAHCYLEIANSYVWINQPQKSQSIYKEALKLFYKLKKYEDYADCLNNLAVSYHDNKEYQKAIELLKQCLQYEPYIKGVQSMPSFYSNLGAAYRELGDYKMATIYFDKSLALQKKDGEYREVYAFLLTEIARNYLLKNDLDNAIKFGIYSKNTGELMTGMRYDANEILYNAYKKKNNISKALKYLELSINSKELTSKQDYEKQANALQFEYDNKKKVLEINLLNNNIEKEKTTKQIYLSGIFMLLLFSFVFWYNNNKLKEKNKKIESQQKQITDINIQLDTLNKSLEQKVAERTIELSNANEELIQKNNEIMTALVKGQTIERKRVAAELHDNLGGTITAIKWQLSSFDTEKLNDKEKKIYANIINMIQSAYKDVRHISHNLLPNEFEEKGLVAAIKKLCEDINNGPMLKASFKNKILQSELITTKIQFELYSICLELVNNILKHSNAVNVQIQLFVKNNTICLIVKDDGIGIEPQKIRNGFGLNNINTRLEAIGGTFSIISHKGTTVSIKIPFMDLK